MKNKERLLYIISGLVIALVTSTITAYASTNYLYNADEVSYQNSSSGLTHQDVQGAIDELYAQATNYTNLNTRITTLEGYFNQNPSSYLNEYGILFEDTQDFSEIIEEINNGNG